MGGISSWIISSRWVMCPIGPVCHTGTSLLEVVVHWLVFLPVCLAIMPLFSPAWNGDYYESLGLLNLSNTPPPDCVSFLPLYYRWLGYGLFSVSTC